MKKNLMVLLEHVEKDFKVNVHNRTLNSIQSANGQKNGQVNRQANEQLTQREAVGGKKPSKKLAKKSSKKLAKKSSKK
jgi:hypothetical protein